MVAALDIDSVKKQSKIVRSSIFKEFHYKVLLFLKELS